MLAHLLSQLELCAGRREHLDLEELDWAVFDAGRVEGQLDLILRAVNNFDIGQAQIVPEIRSLRHRNRLTVKDSEFYRAIALAATNFDPQANDDTFRLPRVQGQVQLCFSVTIVSKACLVILDVEEAVDLRLEELGEAARGGHLLVK